MKDDTRALAWYRRGLVAVGVATMFIGAHALAATPPTIGIKQFKYGPSMLTVPVGTTVTWSRTPSRRGRAPSAPPGS